MPKQLSRIHQNRTPIRRQFIKEWAEVRGYSQAELAKELDVDKSQASRWFAGQLPQPRFQEMIAQLFEIEPEALLRHPDNDWLARFFEGRKADERERIKKTIEAAFPRSTGTDD